MKPNHKIAIVDYYESIDYITVFCGDGANDAGALKHASVGISLSDLEASVASPFTSQQNSIECVATLIQEGRCALVTSFGIFKYMAFYSFVQFISVVIIYWRSSIPSDTEYLYVDLLIIDVIALTATRNEGLEYNKASVI